MASTSAFDSRVLLPLRQRELAAALDVRGFHAFMEELGKIVGEEYRDNPSSQCWGKLRKRFLVGGSDVDSPWFYLHGIHHLVLRGLITGELTSMASHDREFRYVLQQHTMLERMPSIYTNVVCRRELTAHDSLEEFRADADPARWNGYGLTMRQLRSACQTMRQYATADPKYDQMAKSVDDAISGGGLVAGQRMFLPSGSAIKVIENWVDRVEDVVAQAFAAMEEEQLDEPVPWCFQENGWGVHGIQRAAKHTWQENTNYLLGLFFATLEFLFPKQFELRQYRFQRVGEATDADIVEGLAHLVTGSFAHRPYIGLNPTLPGGLPMHGSTSLLDDRYRHDFLRSKVKLTQNEAWDINDRVYRAQWKKVEKDLKMVEDLERKRSEVEKLEEELENRRADFDGDLRRLQEAADDLDRIDSPVEESVLEQSQSPERVSSPESRVRRLVSFFESK